MGESIAITDQNGTITTTSLAVAEAFGKRHHHVMRDIRRQMRSLEKEGQGEWAATNFGFGSYADWNGQLRPMYHLTRKAFDLLAMSYNDSKFVAARRKAKAELLLEFPELVEAEKQRKRDQAAAHRGDRSAMDRLLELNK